MTAQEFWNRFSALFKKGSSTRKKAIENWYCYTDYIIKEIIKILNSYNLICQKEYYKIDLIGYKQLKDNKKICDYLKKYKWSLEIAIEHENNDKTWMDELVKLLNIYCPLRVLIAYLPCRKKGLQKDFLSEINNTISDLYAYNNLQNGEFLLIIGDSKCGGDPEKFCNYTPYIYKNGGFEKLD